MNARFAVDSDAGLVRGVFYGLVFVAPFWIAVAALVIALSSLSPGG